MVKNITERIKKDDLRGPSGKPVKIEVFGHGAVCVAVSGRCSISLLTDNSSANRGACKQPCRRSYTVIDEDTGKALRVGNKYVLSPSDLCTIGKLDEFVETGISILKVEGRGRSPEYVDTVISTYKEALESLKNGTYNQDKIEKWNKDLGTVYNRGFSEGFYMGKPWIEWSGVYGNKATTQKEYVGEVMHYYPKPSIAEVWVQSSDFCETDKYSINGPTTGLVKGEGAEIWVDEKRVAKAEKGQTMTFKVSERVRKGDKLYKIVDVNN